MFQFDFLRLFFFSQIDPVFLEWKKIKTKEEFEDTTTCQEVLKREN